MKETILVADDERLLRELLKDILEDEGYKILLAENGDQVLELLRDHPETALILLDIMMPGKDGLTVLREIKKESEIPVILLTALGSAENEVEGFEMGAVDYIAKPFHKGVLLARIRTALFLKRGEYRMPKEEEKSAMLRICQERCQVWVDEKEVILTNKEYRLLLYLYENENIVLTRDQILERIWGFDYEGDVRTIDTHIKMLRNDLGVCGNYIQTVRGIGYTFRIEEGV